MSFDFMVWFEKLKRDDVIVEYRGKITSEVITGVLEKIEEQLDTKTDDSKLKRKVYNVMVECLQNLYHHSLGDITTGHEDDDKFAAFMVMGDGKKFHVAIGNYVKIKSVQILKDRMDQINSLSKEELKSLYKLILNNQEFSEKGGGGLGMIDIAKRSGSKLKYSFHDVNEDYSFYNLNIEVL